VALPERIMVASVYKGMESMAAGRAIATVTVGAMIAAGVALAPATGAPQEGRTAKRVAPLTRGIGSFTPAAGDPKLAAALAAAGVDGNGFRFTPSEARRNGKRPITVAVRARSNSTRGQAERVAAAAPNVGLTPIAYNLGVAVGWKRFALSGDLARVDLAGLPGSRESVDVGLSYTGNRASARVKAEAARPVGTAPALVAEDQSYAVDLGGSYSLTRNLDVTAGVRYSSDRERIQPIEDNRRDSQAVYIGTAFRF
jgi:hypothetical protein